ncbi:organic hydroperoxide resistance protein [Tundrisphaera sp. TA3]|uniref:organic hydroperoxide resistance protein n=1 Tax=Tundrisphaera sp. TA3 TaxID=3435775 RepID=UPI003EBD3A23
MEPLYTAVAKATSGRDGRATTQDGTLDLALAMPKELGGRSGPGTNPEQLFAAGYAACFGSALKLVAGKRKITATPTVTSRVTIGKDEADGGFKLAVELIGKINGLPAEQVKELMEEAHQVCPYSKATRGNIDVTLSTA